MAIAGPRARGSWCVRERDAEAGRPEPAFGGVPLSRRRMLAEVATARVAV
jgi:hypothetical protein